VHVYDDREDLITMRANAFAHTRAGVDYTRITDHLPNDPDLYVALVSHGYRTDGIILRQLIRRKYRYLGMLGSAAKVERLFAEMKNEGFTDAELARVHAPIGIPIHSRTPEEIAVSIAAEIIGVKNRSRPPDSGPMIGHEES
jgi:xanthine dehydrogenase accessory factor